MRRKQSQKERKAEELSQTGEAAEAPATGKEKKDKKKKEKADEGDTAMPTNGNDHLEQDGEEVVTKDMKGKTEKEETFS